jgi:hypothetical protein
MIRRLLLFIVVLPGLLAATALPAAAAADAQASLAKARELYAAAAYDEALAMLSGLLGDRGAADRPSISMYRVLCLVALGRGGDVGTAIDALVTDHPLYRPPADDLSPRMRTAFTEARARLLPAMIQKRYADGKGAYDRGDFQAAAAAFAWVLSALADPDIVHMANHSPLADIKTLAGGFNDLSQKALAPPPPPPAPVVAAAPPAAPVRDYRRVYTLADADVVQPIPIRQPMPRFPGQMVTRAEGVLELVVDVTGFVESARMLEPAHPQYDPVVVAAAKKWQYQPARVDGVPVKFVKRLQIQLAPDTGR